MKYIGENAIKKLISLIKGDLNKKLDKNQGTTNSGKILGVNAGGEVAPTDTEVATLVDVPNGLLKGDGTTISAVDVPNGLLKGDGTTISAAIAGTDYLAPLEDWYKAMLLNSVTAAMPGGASWLSVCYGNGKLVAIAEGSIAAYSTDGINWTDATLPVEAAWASVCYGNGKFVAVPMDSADSAAAYSTDGINWTQTTMPVGGASWLSVCYGNGKFVAVFNGSADTIYSLDGINWTNTGYKVVDLAADDVTTNLYKALGVDAALSNANSYTDEKFASIPTDIPLPDATITSTWNSVTI